MAMYRRLNPSRSFKNMFRSAKTCGLCTRSLTQRRFGTLVLLLSIGSMVSAQMAPATPSEKSAMHQHYDAAYRFQSSGDFARADVEHSRFLVAALDHMANFHANTGDYAHASPLYDEALALSPSDFGLLMDYAGASLDAHDPKKAKSLLQAAADLVPAGSTGQQKSDIHRMLGRASWALGDTEAAIDQFHAAIALDPNIENMCALGDVELEKDPQTATAIFAKVVAQFGDTAAVRMRIGRIYALALLPGKAVEEFE